VLIEETRLFSVLNPGRFFLPFELIFITLKKISLLI
jgi:hypothetical protein